MDYNVFGQRLKKARTMRQLTLEQLCTRINNKVTKAAVSKYESGKMMPSDDVLEALAKALEVDVSFFSRPMNEDIETCQINFRKKSSMTKGESKALEANVLDKVERYQYVRSLLIDAGVDVACKPLDKKPVKTREEARARAQEMRQAWMSNEEFERDAPIPDVQDFLEGQGIMILPIEVDGNKFDGLSGSVANSNDTFIAIKKNTKYIERRRLTTLHELGHLVMDLSSLTPKEQESLCNEFANEMLMPTRAFDKAFKFTTMNQILMTLRPLQMKYGISIDALMKKADTLHKISSSTYTFYNIYKKQSQSFKDAVEQSIFKESPQYDTFSWKVLRAFSLNLIDREKADQLLYDCSEEARADLKAMS